MTIHLKGFEENHLKILELVFTKKADVKSDNFQVKITIITHQVTVLCQQLKQMKTEMSQLRSMLKYLKVWKVQRFV